MVIGWAETLCSGVSAWVSCGASPLERTDSVIKGPVNAADSERNISHGAERYIRHDSSKMLQQERNALSMLINR